MPPDAATPFPGIISRCLETPVEEAASRAAAEAVAHYLAAHQQSQGGRQNLNGEIPPNHHLGGNHAENKRVRTEDVPLSNARRETTFQEDEADSHGATHRGFRTEGSGESTSAILPAHRSPFTTAILAEVLAVGAKITNLPEYDGTGDPQDHLNRFYAKADSYDLSDAVYYKIFRTTLANRALTWFNKLPLGTIASLEQLTITARREASRCDPYLPVLQSVFGSQGPSLEGRKRQPTICFHGGLAGSNSKEEQWHFEEER